MVITGEYHHNSSHYYVISTTAVVVVSWEDHVTFNHIPITRTVNILATRISIHNSNRNICFHRKWNVR